MQKSIYELRFLRIPQGTESREVVETPQFSRPETLIAALELAQQKLGNLKGHNQSTEDDRTFFNKRITVLHQKLKDEWDIDILTIRSDTAVAS
jgi:hypothetical protein